MADHAELIERLDGDARQIERVYGSTTGGQHFAESFRLAIAALRAQPAGVKVPDAAVDALKFYANPRNWTSGRWVRGSEEDDDADEPVKGLICIDHQIEEDCIAVPFADSGDRARKALSALEPAALSKQGGER